MPQKLLIGDIGFYALSVLITGFVFGIQAAAWIALLIGMGLVNRDIFR